MQHILDNMYLHKQEANTIDLEEKDMEYSELIASRRSIRSFKENVSITRKELEEIICCAQQAPTWKNSQTGRYYIITSDEVRNDFLQKALPEGNRLKCTNVPALIVTAFEKNCSGFTNEGTPENELGNEWGAYDLGLQNAQLILKARELGYDTLIMGIRNSDEIRKLLNVPANQEIVSVIAIGKRVSDPATPPRKQIEEIAKFF